MEDLPSSWYIVVAQGTTPNEFIELNENQDFKPPNSLLTNDRG